MDEYPGKIKARVTAGFLMLIFAVLSIAWLSSCSIAFHNNAPPHDADEESNPKFIYPPITRTNVVC